MAENKTIKNNIGKYLNLAGLTQKELAEVSVTELEEMFKEVRNNAIDEFVKQMKELTYKWIDKGIIAVGCIDEIAEKLKAGEKNE